MGLPPPTMTQPQSISTVTLVGSVRRMSSTKGRTPSVWVKLDGVVVVAELHAGGMRPFRRAR